jgi:dephospho-CoA kinase
MSLLICFSGQIGSGKSSVSCAVAHALGWRRTGFGDYLRAEIERAGGDPSSRQALQDLGQQRIEADAEGFCRDVLNAGGFILGEDFIIDGVRHFDIFRILERLAAPMSARLLFLGADEAARLIRIEARPDSADFERAEGHPVESELRDELPARADAVVDANVPFQEVVSKCLTDIEAWR